MQLLASQSSSVQTEYPARARALTHRHTHRHTHTPPVASPPARVSALRDQSGDRCTPHCLLEEPPDRDRAAGVPECAPSACRRAVARSVLALSSVDTRAVEAASRPS